MTREAFEVLLEKCVSLLLVSFLLLILDWRAVMAIYIVLGQGHFFIAYYYQYKAKKMDRAFGIRYVSCALMLILFFLFAFDSNALLLFTAIFFLQHALFDELILLRASPPRQFNRTRIVEMAPVLLLYTGMLVDGVLHRSLVGWFGLLSALILGIYVVDLHRTRKSLDNISAYFFLCGITLVSVVASGLGQQTPVIKLMGFIILYHYFNWYGYYFHKLSSRAQERRTYFRLAIWVNLSLIMLYGLWRVDALAIGAVLFDENAFYFWTILHLVSSLRADDFKELRDP